MDTVIGILTFITAAMGVVGLLWGLAVAFQRSVGWGVIALLLAPAGIIAFLVLTWRENYRPLGLIIGAVLLGVLAVFLAGAAIGT
jgi:hypothetical protein